MKMRRKEVTIDKDFPFTGCWELSVDYGSLGRGIGGYKKWATGYGELVRHLCSNKRCVNPLHLVRGTHAENVQDERVRRRQICEVLYSKGMDSSEKFRQFVKSYDRSSVDLNASRCYELVIFIYSVCFRFEDGGEIRNIMNRDYSIFISREIDKEFKSYPWTDSFNDRVKKGICLWEIIHNNMSKVDVKLRSSYLTNVDVEKVEE